MAPSSDREASPVTERWGSSTPTTVFVATATPALSTTPPTELVEGRAQRAALIATAAVGVVAAPMAANKRTTLSRILASRECRWVVPEPEPTQFVYVFEVGGDVNVGALVSTVLLQTVVAVGFVPGQCATLTLPCWTAKPLDNALNIVTTLLVFSLSLLTVSAPREPRYDNAVLVLAAVVAAWMYVLLALALAVTFRRAFSSRAPVVKATAMGWIDLMTGLSVEAHLAHDSTREISGDPRSNCLSPSRDLWEAAGGPTVVCEEEEEGGDLPPRFLPSQRCSGGSHHRMATYQGELVSGAPHGRGRLVTQGGDVYEGEFAAGKRHGRGVFTLASGTRYEGEFRASRMHGRGCLKAKSGETYIGEFADDEYHGSGYHEFLDGERYQGKWQAGMMHGIGRWWSAGDEYEGEYAADRRHGRGTYKSRDGASYVGEWRAGEMTGFGRHVDSEGSVYQGEYCGGKKHGTGREELSNGEIAEGVWVLDSRTKGVKIIRSATQPVTTVPPGPSPRVEEVC